MDDPSEYEGTVTRISDPLGAFGSLEQLLTIQNSKFPLMDLSKESDQIYISVFKIKESLQKWNEVSFNNLRLAWDEQAIKIAEYKEEVAARKKVLGAKVRQFLSTLSNDAGGNEEKNESNGVGLAGRAMINSFKVDFDFLAEANRFSEGAFLTTYKLMRDVPDPSEELGECLKVCIRNQETLGNAEEQLRNAVKIVNEAGESHAQSNSAQSTALSDEDLATKNDAQVKELSTKYSGDLAAMKEKLENDMRNKEDSLRSTFDRQQLELEQQIELFMARKDAEVSSLMASLHAHDQRSLENDERRGMLEAEIQKRRDLEERLRASLTDLGAAQTLSHEGHAKCEILAMKVQTSEILLAKTAKQSSETLAGIQLQLQNLTAKHEAMQNELLSRPPADLSALASSVGMVGGALTDGTFDQTMYSNEFSNGIGEKRSFIPWSKIESLVIDCIRKASSEATESRIKEQDAVKNLASVTAECNRLQRSLLEKDSVVVGLERDLQAAHNSSSDSASLLKRDQGKASTGPVKSKASADSTSTCTLRNTATDNSPPVDEINDSWGQADEDLSDYLADANMEKGKGHEKKGLSPLTYDDIKGDRMVVALRGQRDRFMKVAHTKESEVSALKYQLAGALEAQSKLSGENLELFQRLRLLRASSRPPISSIRDVEEGRGRMSSSTGKSRRRDTKGTSLSAVKDDAGDESYKRVDGDDLERKYMHLYEEKIDPFKLEELDRQSLLSRMNVLERGLAYITRFFLNDQWARHALIVYLFLVHGFAICYVFQVLNPQLIEEVDNQMKAKWSAQTLDMVEHLDARLRY